MNNLQQLYIINKKQRGYQKVKFFFWTYIILIKILLNIFEITYVVYVIALNLFIKITKKIITNLSLLSLVLVMTLLDDDIFNT